MKLGVSLGHSLSPSEMVSGSIFCEKSGFDALFVSESTGLDSLTALGAIATKTNGIALGSGVVNVYSRSATQLAMAAATLDELSNSRFMLGIGASSKSVVSGWHGLEFSNQMRRVSQYIDSLRERIKETRSKLGAKTSTDTRILLAAVGEKMISLARSKADGVIFFLRPLDLIGENQSGNHSFLRMASVVTCVSEQPKIAEGRVRKTVAFYIAFGEPYRRLLLKEDLGLLSLEVADSIRREWLRGKAEQAASLVPIELLNQVSIFGSTAECRKMIEQYRSIHNLSYLLLQYNPGASNLLESLSLFGKLSDKATMK